MKNKFILLALSALALAGCSSDKIDVVDDSSTKGFDENGNGYITLAINLPTRGTEATRSNENDQYDDGTADEYKVNDATLILFDGNEGETELQATFGEALDLNFNMNQDVDKDNITVQGRVTKKITNTYHKYKYALVVLNRNGVFTVDSSKKLYFNNDAFTGTFKDFLAKTAESESSLTSNGFFMTNAVLSTTAGNAAPTNANVSTLTNVTDKIYKTQAEAEDAKANVADVIVERAVAKVDVKNAMADKKELSLSGQSLYVTDFNWELCNKNTSSYLVRNWLTKDNAYDNTWLSLYSDGDGLTDKTALNSGNANYNAYRFAGIKEITASGSSVTGTDPTDTYYRTYFGVDPNYDAAPTNFAAPTADGFKLSSGNVAYCLENTFNVANQLVKNTTCAVIKVVFSQKGADNNYDAKDFYVLNGTTSTFYTDGKSDDTNSLNAFVLSYVLNHYQSELKTLAYAKNSSFNKDVTAVTGFACTVTLDNSNNGGAQGISKIALTVSDGTQTAEVEINSDTKISGSETNTVLAQLKSLLNIDLYKDGVAYYTVLIKHFGDDLAPWNTNNRGKDNSNAYAEEASASATAGNTADCRWLGRYGVLRNNWYEVEVSDVKRLGSSTIPTVTTDNTTDDKVEQYLSVRVHVLSWAKRTQGTVLE